MSVQEKLQELDSFTNQLLSRLFNPAAKAAILPQFQRDAIKALAVEARKCRLTGPVIALFAALMEARDQGVTPDVLGFSKEELKALAIRHQEIDEHLVSVGGRLTQALTMAGNASARVFEYLQQKDVEAPSGIEMWEQIQENQARIRTELKMTENDWNSFSGQISRAVDSVDTLARLIDVPSAVLADIGRVTRNYRMRLTPYYTSLILPGKINDPIMLQSVPTGEMIDNSGIEIPPVAADHSPARLIDQFYPRVLTIKATNMCAMYCTHCLRLAHIGRKDNRYSKEAYGEAMDYIRSNTKVRDVLVTGGDAFVLPNTLLKWLLDELDAIDHVKVKRLGTRIPVTAPMRVDSELLDILEESSDRKPIRVVTQINTAQEITPVSQHVFRQLSKRCFTVLNQAVLLKGINDTRVKMWKLCETVHEACIRPYYLFNCSYRNPQFKHFRVPIHVGQDLVESMYGNISGDAIPRYIATAGGKIPLHRSNIVSRNSGEVILRKPWSGEEVAYPDADLEIYHNERFAFQK